MSNKPILSRSFPKAVLLIVAAAVVLVVVGRSLLDLWRPVRMIADSWVFKENRKGPVIGDLGGVPVSIPQPFARFVEYDRDPHFMEKRLLPPPERTYRSRLRSFGFEVRFPDMASEEAKTKENSNIYTTMWMRVGVTAGEHYGSSGDEGLERHVARISDSKGHSFSWEPLPEKTYGLTGYTPVGIDISHRDIPVLGADMRDKNRYYYRDENGRITTYIECSNMKHEAAQCQQRFNLSPIMKAHVRVNYRKGLLPHWREVQSSVSQVIVGFRVRTQTEQRSQ